MLPQVYEGMRAREKAIAPIDRRRLAEAVDRLIDMTINLPKDLESSVRAEVLSGHFPSEDDLVAAAVRAFLRQQPEDLPEHTMNDRQAEPSNQELQQRLLKAGLISEIKPPITDLTPYQNRQAIAVQGEPLSESVIRERR